MDPLFNILQTATIAVIGIAIRFLLAVAIFAAVAAILLPFVYLADAAWRRWLRAAGFEQVAGLTWRRGLYYAPVHTWIGRRASLLRVGFDDIAARVLRHLDEVTLPAEGSTLEAGGALLTAARGNRRIVVPAPIGGVVRRVNRRLATEPDAIVRDPYRRGWLLDVAPIDERYAALPSDSKARGWFAQEASRLSGALEHATGVVAADGGELVIPPDLIMSEEQRDGLLHDFLAAQTSPRGERAGA